MSMISDLVERLRTEAKSMGTYGTDYMATLLTRSADTIEMLSEKAREPKRGEWIVKQSGFAECSVCEQHYFSDYNYCPNCGAKMDGDRKESE